MGDLHPSNPPENGPSPPLPSQETLIPSSTSKRQRRPSVRLGEIGDQATAASPSFDPSSRRKLSSKILPSSSSSIILPSKPSTKPRLSAPRRPRTNWTSPIDSDLKSSDDSEESPDDRVRVSNGGGEDGSEEEEEEEDGVRGFLEGLGLGRYAPIFDMHEVDDDVLPMLTPEDLRDMGINAVGSRRKMYCAIQKLGRRTDSS